MPTFGPIYCETLGFSGMFPAEPVNTISNAAIVLFGVLSLFMVRRRAPRAYDLYVLCFLLIVNGIGSFLWHGTRTRWALTLDVMPGLIFLLALVFFWARRLWSSWQAGLFLGGFYLALQYLRQAGFGGYGRWATMTPAILVFGAALIVRTLTLSRSAALFGALAITSAMLALTFRTIDQAACAYVPFGTHFLWHIFLSGAAFLGIMAVIALTRVNRPVAATTRPVETPAE